MKRTIYLPSISRSVTLREYNQAIKLAKKNPDVEFKYGLSCWWPCSGREIMRQFFDGLQDRINSKIPYIQRGIK